MKVAAIYDIHGNVPALEAVLKEIQRGSVDLLVVGGDVATGPMPRGTVELLMALPANVVFLRGNADREVVECFDSLNGGGPTSTPFASAHETSQWTALQLERRHRDFLDSFVEKSTVAVDGLGEVLFCHGSPRSDEEMITAATTDERLGPMLVNVEAPVVVCGHTHMQFDLRSHGKRIVNAGSVGMPYADQPGAYWVQLGPTVAMRRTEYDLARAADLIRQSGMPGAREFADENVLTIPSAAAATEIFERMASEHPFTEPTES
jgi:putative phosphoesterase